MFVRLQSRKLKINYKAASPIEVDIQKSLDSILFNETKISLEGFKKVIYDIAFEEERIKARKSEEERKAAEAAANRMTLNKFIDLYVQEISSGERQTSKGMNFKPGTAKCFKQIKTVMDVAESEGA